MPFDNIELDPSNGVGMIWERNYRTNIVRKGDVSFSIGTTRILCNGKEYRDRLPHESVPILFQVLPDEWDRMNPPDGFTVLDYPHGKGYYHPEHDLHAIPGPRNRWSVKRYINGVYVREIRDAFTSGDKARDWILKRKASRKILFRVTTVLTPNQAAWLDALKEEKGWAHTHLISAALDYLQGEIEKGEVALEVDAGTGKLQGRKHDTL